MEDINKGARPEIAPYLVLEAVDFKVTDPTAADPNAPVRMLWVNQPFTMHFVIKLSGIWKDLFNSKEEDEKWETKFYADSIGVDVSGEKHWYPEKTYLPDPIAPDTFDLTFSVQQGLPNDGLYELGAYTRLPGKFINAYIEGYHIEVAAP